MCMKKSVGPVGAMTVRHCLIQMRSGGSKAGPRISEDLAFCTTTSFISNLPLQINTALLVGRAREA